MNDKQADLFNKFKEGISMSIGAYPVLHSAVCISTPFRDFAGDHFHIYATEDGKITDGGSTLNMFKSLRCYQDYLDYPFRGDYFARYGIKEESDSLICADLTACGIVRYAQGVSDLRKMFEANPL